VVGERHVHVAANTAARGARVGFASEESCAYEPFFNWWQFL
jgi:hypothetical protein